MLLTKWLARQNRELPPPRCLSTGTIKQFKTAFSRLLLLPWTIRYTDSVLYNRYVLTHPKISIAEIARLFGRDMTYHAVENYLRKFRKEAKDMKGGTAGRDIVAPSTPRLKKKAKDVSPTKSEWQHFMLG